MAKKILVPVANGTEEMEAVIIIDILRRADLEVIIAGTEEQVVCSRGTKIVPDVLIKDVINGQMFDAIIIPGGWNGTVALNSNSRFIEILKKHYERGVLIGAICAGPLILNDNDILHPEDIVTSHPSVKDKIDKCQYSENNVEISGNLITSRAAGTAIDFALKIVEILCGDAISEKIRKDILYNK